jgi:hypothetical protein
MLFNWRKATISKCGPKPTTRLLLLTLSVHMDGNGGSCFPSTRKLAEETGLSERTVCTHLEIAEKEGWIKKMKQGLTGRSWKRHSYQAAIPPEALKQVQHPKQQGTEPHAEGTEPNDNEALKQVQSSTSYSSIYTSDSAEYGLSQMLLNLILERNPKYKQPDLQKWAKNIDLAMRRDNRTPAELEAVIRWCQSESFWQNNILSTEKLRKQFDTLWMQMKGNGNAANRTGKKTDFGKHGARQERSGKYSHLSKSIPAEG